MLKLTKPKGPTGPLGPFGTREITLLESISESMPMDQALPEITHQPQHAADATFSIHPDYNGLPMCVRSSISPKEFAWMGDSARADLVRDLTTPMLEDE